VNEEGREEEEDNMNKKPLLLALAFAFLSVVALLMYTKQLRAEVSGGEKVSILVVSKATKKGTVLEDAQLGVRDVPIAYVGDRAVRASDRSKVLGVRVANDLDPQQTLEWHDLALSKGDSDRHLSELVQPGTRALTLHIPPGYMSVELLRPGDYVDVLGVLEEQKGAPQAVVLLQRVLVLAVGTETTPRHETKGNKPGFAQKTDELLTLSVTLQEAQTIALAAQKGPVMAVLRNAADPSVASKVPTLSRVLVKDPEVRAAPKEAAPQKLNVPPAAEGNKP
jgi:pilus assembly protein CpaB